MIYPLGYHVRRPLACRHFGGGGLLWARAKGCGVTGIKVDSTWENTPSIHAVTRWHSGTDKQINGPLRRSSHQLQHHHHHHHLETNSCVLVRLFQCTHDDELSRNKRLNLGLDGGRPLLKRHCFLVCSGCTASAGTVGGGDSRYLA